jgi:hypothetical protein
MSTRVDVNAPSPFLLPTSSGVKSVNLHANRKEFVPAICTQDAMKASAVVKGWTWCSIAHVQSRKLGVRIVTNAPSSRYLYATSSALSVNACRLWVAMPVIVERSSMPKMKERTE